MLLVKMMRLVVFCLTAEVIKGNSLVEQTFRTYNIGPPLFRNNPQNLLHVTYGEHEILLGTELSKSQGVNPPNISFTGTANTLHTLLLLDLDVLTPQSPTCGPYLHWMMVNIANKDVNSGNIRAEYRAPAPRDGVRETAKTGGSEHAESYEDLSVYKEADIHGACILNGSSPTPVVSKAPHRYVFLLFEQQWRISLDAIPYISGSSDLSEMYKRTRFDVVGFSMRNGLGEPVAGNFFTATHRLARSSCYDIQTNFDPKYDGIYQVEVGNGDVKEVFCDLNTDGGGWTVVQRRVDAEVNFARNWQSYKKGFGSLTGSFWLGNDYIWQLTNGKPSELRVEMSDCGGDVSFVVYLNFYISDEDSGYQLSIGDVSGTSCLCFAQLIGASGVKFSTFDRVNVKSPQSCNSQISSQLGGFWYADCESLSTPNAVYPEGCQPQCQSCVTLSWPWFKEGILLQRVEMKIREAKPN